MVSDVIRPLIKVQNVTCSPVQKLEKPTDRTMIVLDAALCDALYKVSCACVASVPPEPIECILVLPVSSELYR
jgi:hypothetical protein